MANKKNTINTNHPRIKNRTPKHQQSRDELAKVLREKKGNNEFILDTKKFGKLHFDINSVYDDISGFHRVKEGFKSFDKEEFDRQIYLDKNKNFFKALDEFESHENIDMTLITNNDEMDYYSLMQFIDKRGEEHTIPTPIFEEVTGIQNKPIVVEDAKEAYEEMAEEFFDKNNNWKGSKPLQLPEIKEKKYDDVFATEYWEKQLLDHYNINVGEIIDRNEYDEYIEQVATENIQRIEEEFDYLKHKELAEKLIEKGYVWYVAENLEEFEGLNKEIAEKLIEKGQEWAVVQNLEEFEGLNKETAEKLIEKGAGGHVAENLEKFEGLNLNKEIAEKLIEKGAGWYVAENLEKFEGLKHKELAEKLIEKGAGGHVAENLEKFEGLKHKELAEKLIEKGKGWDVVRNLEKFKGLDKEIAKGLDKEIANKWIEDGYSCTVAKNLEKFEKLDDKILEKLIEMGYEEKVKRYLLKHKK